MRALRGLRAPKLKGANIIKQIGAKIRDPIGIKARRQEKIALADDRLKRARAEALAHDPAVKAANIAVKNAQDALTEKQKNAKKSRADEAAVATKCKQRSDTRLGKRTRWQNFWGGLGRFTKDEATDARLDRIQAEQDALDKERAMDIAEAEAFLATADPADRDAAQDALANALAAPRKMAALVHAPGPAIGKGFWAYPAAVLWNRSVIGDDARFKDSLERQAAAQTRIARAEITKARAALNEAQRAEMLRISASEQAQRAVTNAQTVRNTLNRTWMDGLKDRGAQLADGLQKIPGAEKVVNTCKWYAGLKTRDKLILAGVIGGTLAMPGAAIAAAYGGYSLIGGILATLGAGAGGATMGAGRTAAAMATTKGTISGMQKLFDRPRFREFAVKNPGMAKALQIGGTITTGVSVAALGFILGREVFNQIAQGTGGTNSSPSETPGTDQVARASTTAEMPVAKAPPPPVPADVPRVASGDHLPAPKVTSAPPEIGRGGMPKGYVRLDETAPPDIPADAAAPAPEAVRPAVSGGIQTGDPETMTLRREVAHEVRDAPLTGTPPAPAVELPVEAPKNPLHERTGPAWAEIDREYAQAEKLRATELERQSAAAASGGEAYEGPHDLARRQAAAAAWGGEDYERPEDRTARARAGERYAIEQHQDDQRSAAQAGLARSAIEGSEGDQAAAAADREATVRAHALEDQRLARETAEAFRNRGVHGAFRTMMEDPNSSITHAASEAGINFEGNNKEGLSEALNRTLAKNPKFMSYFDTSDHTASIRTEGGKFMSKVDIDPSDPKSGEIVRGMFKNLSSDKAFMAEFEKTLQSGTYETLRSKLGGSEKISALIRKLQE